MGGKEEEEEKRDPGQGVVVAVVVLRLLRKIWSFSSDARKLATWADA